MLVVVDGKEITMPTDFTFTLPNQPGTGARVLDALGHAGVNIIGACAVSQDGDSTVHLAVDDAEEARTVEDRPGAGARLLRRLGDAGINVDFLYLASNNRLVLGVADVNKALGVL
jgi:hypothetical protein